MSDTQAPIISLCDEQGHVWENSRDREKRGTCKRPKTDSNTTVRESSC